MMTYAYFAVWLPGGCQKVSCDTFTCCLCWKGVEELFAVSVIPFFFSMFLHYMTQVSTTCLVGQGLLKDVFVASLSTIAVTIIGVP